MARSQREPKKKWHGRFEALGVKLLHVFTPMLRLVYDGQSKNYKATSLLRKVHGTSSAPRGPECILQGSKMDPEFENRAPSEALCGGKHIIEY